jgi:hypothetical protein
MHSSSEVFTNHNSKPVLIRKLFLIVGILGFFYACTKDTAPTAATTSGDCSTTPKSFSIDVNPVIQASCASSGCHGAGSNNGPGALLSYSQIFNARSSIRSAVSSGRMPKNGSLTAAEKAKIICWIDSGSPND